MKIVPKSLFPALALVVCLQTFAQSNDDSWTPIERRLSAEDFYEMGLNKLSSDELNELNTWLENNTYRSKVIIKKEVVYQKPDNNKPRHLRIQGQFEGWKGKTVFKMDNGEVWIQRISGRYTKNLDSPEIVISKNNLGFYMMTVSETGRSIGVKKQRR